ncbi:MAG: UDP-N-acetylglucosamine 1-carboxyvinyltransferase [Clostridia bacterium]|nr:UDP-N-acetylglucosamine 1-carboxyvinyltransferase [Clostridia bacterium]MDE7328335.1 UDP-N-acetylglucosamine 1-carboxyvinyltransferase [Clostridia bacterium]
MKEYIINGGRPLEGTVEIRGAKNSILPLLAGCILTDEIVVLHDCPHISDVDSMIKILEVLGCKIIRKDRDLIVDSGGVCNSQIPSSLAKELRSSIFLLGSLLSRLKKAKVAYPGGCDIGLRPIDIHIAGLRELNIDIQEQGGFIVCNSQNAKCADVVLDLPSVGATENLMMSSVFVKGKTVIRNCAKEPEIVDLQKFLNAMGAKIKGAGSSVIVVEGVDRLHGVEYTPIPDRIVAGTYLIATAMCGGNVELKNVNSEHISSLISKLSKTTCKIYVKNDRIIVKSKGRQKSLDCIETMYYPGFPTDLQSQIMAMQTVSRGTSVIVENIFETRFKTASELKKLGADVTIKGKVAVVRGVKELIGSEVTATDLRGGASLVLAGLVAKGETIVKDIHHIDRGYEDMSLDLSALGANIRRT